MKKLSHILFLLFIVIFLSIDAAAQDCSSCGTGCTSMIINSKKIFFQGKAPDPWAIDGQITDWQEILGASNEEDVLEPFELPDSTAFNWALDADSEEELTTDCSSDFSSHIFDAPLPEPGENIRLSAFTHDDFNVFFYFRRLSNSNTQNSFYYFCDVDADGYMNEGEPVFHASFTTNNHLALILSRYLPDIHHNYIEGKGNPLAIVQEDEMGALSKGPIVQNYPMPGNLEKVFDFENIPYKKRLRENESFAASFTEDGYGVELAIPWRYLRLWLVDKKKMEQIEKLEKLIENLIDNYPWLNYLFVPLKKKLKDLFEDRWLKTKPLKPEDIFFYKLSLKQGGGKYAANEVVDNVGNPCDGVSKSGDVSFDTSIASRGFIPDSGYRFSLRYTNITNATEVFDITGIVLDNIKFDRELPPNDEEEDISIKIYSDKNCNGIPELTDSVVQLVGVALPGCTVNTDMSLQKETKPSEGACFIIDVLPRDHALIVSGEINIQPTVNFIPIDPCIFCTAGRTIKQVGIMRTDFSFIVISNSRNNVQLNAVEAQPDPSQVLVYPNPNRGSAKVYIPIREGAASIVLEDYSGRKLQQWNNYTSTNLQINNLKPGFYLLKVYYAGKVITKKIVVQ